MEDSRRQRRDFLQNIIIVVLVLSAVALFAQTQLYNLGPNRYISQLTGTASTGEAASVPQPTDLVAPVRVAVTGTYGRCGNVTLTTADEEFTSALGRLLGDALGSAKSYTACSEKEFQQALNSASVYYDFLNPLPLSILAGLVGTSGEEAVSARYLAVCDQGTAGVRLFLWGGSHCRVSATAVSLEDLAAVVDRYEPGTADFAFDQDDPNAALLAPLSLLPAKTPVLPVLTAVPASETDLILTTFGFNPRTNYRYTESAGTEVVKEGDRSLRIRADGTVLYTANSEAALTVEAADAEHPTAREAASGAAVLLSNLLTAEDASPYLESIAQSDSTTVLRFSYQTGGIPIRFSDGGCAAEVTLSGNVIVKVSLHLRRYSASADTSTLLPLRQAMAIAAMTPGAELSVGYADNGSGTVSAGWLAD